MQTDQDREANGIQAVVLNTLASGDYIVTEVHAQLSVESDGRAGRIDAVSSVRYCKDDARSYHPRSGQPQGH